MSDPWRFADEDVEQPGGKVPYVVRTHRTIPDIDIVDCENVEVDLPVQPRLRLFLQEKVMPLARAIFGS